MDFMCIDFNKVDPLKDVKENILVLTDTFTKFNQAFVTPNQKVITFAKILVDKWFYVYGFPVHIHSDKGHSFDNEIMSHLYAIYGVEQSTTTPYNPCGNVPTERLNCTLIGLLKSLPKEQKSNWPLHLPLLVFAYNTTPRDTIWLPAIWPDVWMQSTNYLWCMARAGKLQWQLFAKQVWLGLINSMNSFLLLIGGHWKEWKLVQ